jgi:hypothetical protein
LTELIVKCSVIICDKWEKECVPIQVP